MVLQQSLSMVSTGQSISQVPPVLVLAVLLWNKHQCQVPEGAAFTLTPLQGVQSPSSYISLICWSIFGFAVASTIQPQVSLVQTSSLLSIHPPFLSPSQAFSWACESLGTESLCDPGKTKGLSGVLALTPCYSLSALLLTCPKPQGSLNEVLKAANLGGASKTRVPLWLLKISASCSASSWQSSWVVGAWHKDGPTSLLPRSFPALSSLPAHV